MGCSFRHEGERGRKEGGRRGGREGKEGERGRREIVCIHMREAKFSHCLSLRGDGVVAIDKSQHGKQENSNSNYGGITDTSAKICMHVVQKYCTRHVYVLHGCATNVRMTNRLTRCLTRCPDA